MIKVINNGKVCEFADISQMMSRLKFNRIREADRLSIIKSSQKGDALYVSINPYLAEMSQGEDVPIQEVLLASSQDDLDKKFYALKDEI